MRGRRMMMAASGVEAGGGSSIFASDDFTDTDGTLLQNHTPSGGGSWIKHGGQDAQISGNRVIHSSGAEGNYYHSADPTSADYIVAADVVMRSDNDSSEACVLGRQDPNAGGTTETYYMARYATNGNAWQLFKRVSGSFTLLGSFAQALTVDQAYRLELSMVGTAIKLLVDSVERVSVTDSGITAAGKAGLRTVGGSTSTTGAHLDNWEASDV